MHPADAVCRILFYTWGRKWRRRSGGTLKLHANVRFSCILIKLWRPVDWTFNWVVSLSHSTNWEGKPIRDLSQPQMRQTDMTLNKPQLLISTDMCEIATVCYTLWLFVISMRLFFFFNPTPTRVSAHYSYLRVMHKNKVNLKGLLLLLWLPNVCNSRVRPYLCGSCWRTELEWFLCHVMSGCAALAEPPH